MSYPAYVEMKDSGVEWIGDVPRHWEPVRFKFIAAFYGGGTPSKDNASYWKGDIPWVSPKDMKCRVIYDSEDHISEEALKGSATRLIEKGAVLIVVRSGILKHSIPVAINAVPVALNQDMKAIVPGDKIEASFLAHLIDGCQNALLLEWRKSGATVESLEHDYIANTTLILPQPDEQRAIVRFLNSKTDEIDALIKLKERQLELLDKKRQALISHAVTRGLDSSAPLRPSDIQWFGDIPAHWEVQRIKFNALKIGSGKTPKGGAEVYVDKGVVFLRSQNIHDDGLRLEDVVYISNAIDKEMSETRVLPRDVLLNITGASIGRACCVPSNFPKANVNQHVCIIRLKEGLEPEYLAYFLQSGIAKGQILSLENGSSREGLNFEQVGNLVFTLPANDPDEQREIVAFLNIETARIDGIAQTVQMQINKLRDYRQSLISAAVTGKIDVRGETDDTVRGVDKKRAGRRG
jgi:type I restriction enzyme S subunit